LEYEFSGSDFTAANLIVFVCARGAHDGGREMERRTLIGGLLLSSGIVGVRCPVAARGWRDSEANEEAIWRLQNAHEFFPTAEFARPADRLYQIGIVSQLALTACLVANGWSDEDCRRHIGQDVGKAWFFANAGGLHFHSARFARLVPLLSPYGRWRSPAPFGAPETAMIDSDEARVAVSHLLAAVRARLVGAVAKGERP
jgi:hypothetical protein